MITRHYYSANVSAIGCGNAPGRLTIAKLPGDYDMSKRGHDLLWGLYEEAYGGSEVTYRVYARQYPDEPTTRPAWVANYEFECDMADRIALGLSKRWQDYQ